MIWLFTKRPSADIPPPPDHGTDDEATRRMAKLVDDRSRRGKRLTRHTQHAIAQNHFVLTFKHLFPDGDGP